MKIITKNKGYVQLADVIDKDPTTLPASILKEVFSSEIKNETNKNTYLCFDDVDAIAFIKNDKGIVDYNKIVKGNMDIIFLTIAIRKKQYNTLMKLSRKLDKLNIKLLSLIKDKCLLLEKEVNALEKVLLYRENIYPLDIPEEILTEIDTSKVKKIKNTYNK